MSHAIQAVLQQQAQKVAQKLKHPRRAVDEQGRSVQFPQGKPLIVAQILMGLCGLLFVLIAVALLTNGETMGGIALLVVGLFFISCIWIFGRVSKAWYYEDDYGFEFLTFYRHKKISMSYDDIASWYIDQQRVLRVKTHDKKKAAVSLPYFRPLILLDTLVKMELDGRFGEYVTEEQRNQVIWELDSEFCEHANKVVEEMQKTGATIYIPER